MKVARSRIQATSNTQTLTRAPAPHGPPETLDPYFRGSNVLTDPGFETFVDNSGGWYFPDRPGGGNDFYLPYLDVTCPTNMKWADQTCATGWLVSWIQCSGPYEVNSLAEDQAWKISTADPHSGDYHAVWWHSKNGSIPPGELCVISPWLSRSVPFSARVEPGDSVTFSGYAKAGYTIPRQIGAVPPDVDIHIIPTLRFYAANTNLLRAVQSGPTEMTLSYTQYSVSTTAPAGTSYLRASFMFAINLNPIGYLYPWVSATMVDSCVLGIT